MRYRGYKIKPHYAHADAIGSGETPNAQPAVTPVKHESTLETARENFIKTLSEHAPAMVTLFKAAHKNIREDGIGPSRKNDAINFEAALNFIADEVSNYKTDPNEKFIHVYAKQSKVSTTLKDALRNFKVYCSAHGSLKHNTAHYFETIEQDILNAYADFRHAQEDEHPEIQKLKTRIRTLLARRVITKHLKRIPKTAVGATVDAFMETVRNHQNSMAIYKHVMILLKTDDDQMPLRNVAIRLYDKDPEAAFAIEDFARAGARELQPHADKWNKIFAAKRPAALKPLIKEDLSPANDTASAPDTVKSYGDGRYGPFNRPVGAIEINSDISPRGPIPQNRAVLSEKDTAAIRALLNYVPAKEDRVAQKPVVGQGIKAAASAPLNPAAKKQKWHQRLVQTLNKKTIAVTTAFAAAALVLITAISILKPAPEVNIASISAPNMISASTLTPAIPPLAPDAASAQIQAPTPAATPASTLTIPLSDAPEITANDFQTAKPANNTLSAAPSFPAAPSWAAQGTLGLDLNSLSSTFAEQTQEIEKTAPTPTTDTPAKASAPVKTLAQTADQITNLMIKNKALEIGIDGNGDVTAKFNTYADAFKATQGKDFNAKSVKIKGDGSIVIKPVLR